MIGLRAALLAALLVLSGAVMAAPLPADARLLDDLVGAHVGGAGAPGAVAAVVHADGGVTLEGFGFADLATGRRVDPERTIFRIGSITKTFTALAVLQLVEEGKVDLNADANRYLKGVRIPVDKGVVRVVDLLTHRSGFDGDITYVGLDDPDAAARSSDARLQRDIYTLRKPGQVAVYDNLAWGLLGQLLESVEGQPYASVIARRIFGPLGMIHARIGRPASMDDLARPYEVDAQSRPQATAQMYLRRGWQGAGDISVTAGDMVLFLKAMLAQGEYPGGRLLSKTMFARFCDTSRFRLNPGIPGTGLGVYALGNRTDEGFGHGGTIRGFNSIFMVMPREGAAVFVSMNLNTPAPSFDLPSLVRYVTHPPGRQMMDAEEYLHVDFPALVAQRMQPPSPLPIPSVGADRAQWSGRYFNMRAESYEALLPRLVVSVLVAPTQVAMAPDGALTIRGNGPYRPAAPGLYTLDREAGPLATVVGFEEIDGRAVMAPHTLFASRRLSWYERPGITVAGLLLAPLLLLAASATRLAIRWRAPPILDWWIAGTALVVIAGLAFELADASCWSRELDRSVAVAMVRVTLNLAFAGLAASTCLACARTWRPGAATPAWQHRLYPTAALLLSGWALFGAAYWHVLGRF